jgi:carboxylate-amine ligase
MEVGMESQLTVGVEEEYQLVCPATGELRSRAPELLRDDWSGELQAEAQRTMVEVGTGICRHSGEVRAELARLRAQAATSAGADDLAIVAAGVHPTSRWEAHRVSPGDRYRRLEERFGRVLRSEHVFGMHVHVGIPAGTDRMELIGRLRAYVPHLVALAASSPVYEGADTGYASYRTILASRLPHAGIPPRLASEDEAARLIAMFRAAGALERDGAVYWTIRPHETYPTVEIRCTDCCPSLDDAEALAGLARILVAHALEGRLSASFGTLSEAAAEAVIRGNEWQAARYGLDASLIAPERPTGAVVLADAVRALLDDLVPTAEAIGEGGALRGVEAIVQRGNAARRIREVWEECGELDAVTAWLMRETMMGVGMDRRHEQRESRCD